MKPVIPEGIIDGALTRRMSDAQIAVAHGMRGSGRAIYLRIEHEPHEDAEGEPGVLQLLLPITDAAEFFTGGIKVIAEGLGLNANLDGL